VPEAAVQASERGFITYVVDGDKVRLRTVQVGLRSGTGVVEVLSGLTAGQTVVTEGSDRLADGWRSRSRPDPPALPGSHCDRDNAVRRPRPPRTRAEGWTPSRSPPHDLADISIRNHVFVWILMGALIGFGMLTYTGWWHGAVRGWSVSQNRTWTSRWSTSP